jgi:hypothetical protein
MRTWTSLVAVIVSTAAVAHAASFYGTIRITNDGIPGSGVALSTSLVDFLAPSGPPNGQAIVQLVVSSDNNPGPIPGSAVLVKDFTPGSFVTDFLTFATMSPGPGYNGGSVPPSWPTWDAFRPLGPPYFVDPTGCAVNPSPFCVMDYPLGGSIAFFELRGSTSGQLGYWEALFGALLPQSPAEVIAQLKGGQTLVSNAWTADVTTAPEPATSTALVTSICLLILVRRRFRVPGAR